MADPEELIGELRVSLLRRANHAAQRALKLVDDCKKRMALEGVHEGFRAETHEAVDLLSLRPATTTFQSRPCRLVTLKRYWRSQRRTCQTRTRTSEVSALYRLSTVLWCGFQNPDMVSQSGSRQP